MSNNQTAFWGLVYSTNSNSPRARRWYHISRVVRVDGAWWELYHHPAGADLCGENRDKVRQAAELAGVEMVRGEFTSPTTTPHHGGRLVRRLGASIEGEQWDPAAPAPIFDAAAAREFARRIPAGGEG